MTEERAGNIAGGACTVIAFIGLAWLFYSDWAWFSEYFTSWNFWVWGVGLSCALTIALRWAGDQPK